MDNILEVKNLKVTFPYGKVNIEIIRGIDFTLKSGEILGIIGESGSGKTITAKSINGLIKEDEGNAFGSILFLGSELLPYLDKKLRSIRGSLISYIFQDPQSALNPYRKIGSQIKEVLKAHKCKIDKTLILDTLERVGIENPNLIYNLYPYQLSGGLCQRVTIAMSIILKPTLIIADEPTTSIDATLQKKVLTILKDICRRDKTSIIMITHDFDVAKYICEKLCILYTGLIMEEGPLEAIMARPLHPYTKALIACSSSLDNEDKVLYTLEGRAPSFSTLEIGCPFYSRCPKEGKNDVCRKSLPPLRPIGSGRKTRCLLFDK